MPLFLGTFWGRTAFNEEGKSMRIMSFNSASSYVNYTNDHFKIRFDQWYTVQPSEKCGNDVTEGLLAANNNPAYRENNM